MSVEAVPFVGCSHTMRPLCQNKRDRPFEREGDVGVKRTRLRSGDGALIHRNSLAHVVEGLQCDHVVRAGV